jgi:hypothetical protein
MTMKKSKLSHIVIKELLGLNEFYKDLKKRIRKNHDRIEAVRYLRDLVDMHPNQYRLEYRIEKEPLENYELLLLEKHRLDNKEIWEVVNSTTQILDGYPHKFG